jgi:hypothetical protein
MDFEWVKVDDASGILGSARPENMAGLLKKPRVWHELYAGWLATYHANLTVGWEFVERTGGRPRVHGRADYDGWIAALDRDFPAFYNAVGRLKKELDPRTGTSRKLAHLTGQVAGAAREAAQSRYVTTAAAAVGAEGVRRVVAGAAGQVGKAVGVTGPQSVRDAPAAPATQWAASTDLDNYLAWLAHVHSELQLYGGVLADYAARLGAVTHKVDTRRRELRAAGDAAAVRLAAYWLGYSVDLWDLAVPPHHSVIAMVNDLHERHANALYLQLHPLLGALLDSIGNMYDCGLAFLAAGDGLIDTGQFQLTTLRAELPGLLPDPKWDAEPTDADETAAREVFGKSYADFR